MKILAKILLCFFLFFSIVFLGSDEKTVDLAIALLAIIALCSMIRPSFWKKEIRNKTEAEKNFTADVHQKKRGRKRKQEDDDLYWIDELEFIDAIFDDD